MNEEYIEERDSAGNVRKIIKRTVQNVEIDKVLSPTDATLTHPPSSAAATSLSDNRQTETALIKGGGVEVEEFGRTDGDTSYTYTSPDGNTVHTSTRHEHVTPDGTHVVSTTATTSSSYVSSQGYDSGGD